MINFVVFWSFAGYKTAPVGVNTAPWDGLRAAAPGSGSFLDFGHPAPFNFTYFEMGNEIYGSWEADKHGSSGDSLVVPSGDTRKSHDPTTLIAFANGFESAISGFLNDGMESGAVPIHFRPR